LQEKKATGCRRIKEKKREKKIWWSSGEAGLVKQKRRKRPKSPWAKI
jgi:hypothetical protein